ncbi:MAG TPA: tetratricopeptide repeat protein [Gemmatimonadaceae bacterium]|nr:tetratricopeptide repeat protein [Gemmatimonadaceae bacterium]
MRFRHLALAALIGTMPIAAGAQQSTQASVAAGDRAYESLQVADALTQFESAIEADSSHYEALWKASRAAVDLAEYEPNAQRKQALFEQAERHARRAVAVNANDAEGHFAMARALGRVALTKGVRDRVRYATQVRASALRALELSADHPGALHVLGRWNAEVMRLSGLSRFFAKNLLGGRVFDQANWDDARRYLERAVAVDPQRLVHNLGLAEIYLDLKETGKAREQLTLVVNGTASDYNDQHYQREARALLEKIG